MNKTCRKCGETKECGEFRVRVDRPGQLYSWCIQCKLEYDRKYYKDNERDRQTKVKAARDKVRKRNQEIILCWLEAHPCVDCGEPDPIVLEFDHLQADEKVVEVSTLTTASKYRLLVEMAKCEVVCANCHRRRTYVRGVS